MEIFSGALIFSIWSVTLFFGKRIGLSMLLFIAPIAYFIVYLLEENTEKINQKAKIWIIPIGLLASTYFLFDHEFFRRMNIFVILILLVVMIWELQKEKIKFKIELIGKIIGMFLLPLNFMSDTFRKLRQIVEIKLNIDPEKHDYETSDKIKKIIKSVVLSLPMIWLILILLATADEIFGSIFVRLFGILENVIVLIPVEDTFVRIILTGGAFVYFACFFDFIVSRYPIEEIEEVQERNDSVTMKILLGSLNIIYLIFCIIQIQSLFLKNVNINYAQYARQGFFQLMWVSVINLVMILMAKKNQPEKGKCYINTMCLLMIVFTFIILVSSALRMYFYESAYGYTFLRLLVFCTLFTEAILLIPTIFYILDQKINLGRTYFSMILIVYIGMNFMNFDQIIAKRNIDRYIETGAIDLVYLEIETGTDAVSQMMRILETKIGTQQIETETRKYLNRVYTNLEEQDMDFRDYNISRSKARKLLEEKLK